MRKRKSYEDAVAQFDSLLMDERRDFEAIKAARDRVRRAGRKVTRETVREEAGCARELAILYMGLLEALESARGGKSHEDEPSTKPSSVHPLIASAIAETRALTDRLESTFGGVIDEAVRDERERTRQGLAVQIAATETAVAEMTERSDDFEVNAESLAATSIKQKAAIARLESERAEAREEIVRLAELSAVETAAKKEMAGNLAIANDQILELKNVNGVVSAELSHVRTERDALKEDVALISNLRTNCAVLQEKCEARLREISQYASTVRTMREEHAREMAKLREEHQIQLAAERARVVSLETGIVDALKFANANGVVPSMRSA